MQRAAIVGLSIVGAFLLVGVLAVFRPGPLAPRMTCALPDTAPCQHTYDSITFPMSSSLYPELDGVLTAIHVQPAPDEWENSFDPAFKDAEWAALIERWDNPPVLTACYYDSDESVTCHTVEGGIRPRPDRSTPSPFGTTYRPFAVGHQQGRRGRRPPRSAAISGGHR